MERIGEGGRIVDVVSCRKIKSKCDIFSSKMGYAKLICQTICLIFFRNFWTADETSQKDFSHFYLVSKL